MKKFLVALTGLISLSTVALPLTEQAGKANLTQETYGPEWNFIPKTESKKVGPTEWFYFAIDSINLSLIGIRSIEKLHSFSRIEVPGLVVKFDGQVEQSGDIWYPDRRGIGSEDWNRMFTRTRGWTTMDLESAATLWYSNSGNLMMRLAYHASMITYIPPSVVMGGTISFESGSRIKFID